MKVPSKGKLTITVEILDGEQAAQATGDEISDPAIKMKVRMRAGQYRTREICEAGPREDVEQGPVAGIVSALAEVLEDEEVMQEVMEIVANKIRYAHEGGHCPACAAESKSESGLADMPAEGHA